MTLNVSYRFLQQTLKYYSLDVVDGPIQPYPFQALNVK